MVNQKIELLRDLTDDHFLFFSHEFVTKRPTKATNFGCCAFGWPQLECFQSLLSLPPMWREFFSVLRKDDDRQKTRQRWERIISFSTHRLLFLLWKRKRNIVEYHYFDNQILLQGASSIRTMTQKSFLLKYKFPCLIFFIELRASSLQFKRFIQTSLRCSFFGIRNNKGLFLSQNASHWNTN